MVYVLLCHMILYRLAIFYYYSFFVLQTLFPCFSLVARFSPSPPGLQSLSIHPQTLLGHLSLLILANHLAHRIDTFGERFMGLLVDCFPHHCAVAVILSEGADASAVLVFSARSLFVVFVVIAAVLHGSGLASRVMMMMMMMTGQRVSWGRQRLGWLPWYSD